MKFMFPLSRPGWLVKMVFLGTIILGCCAWSRVTNAEEKGKTDSQPREFSADVVRKNLKESKNVTRGRMYVGQSGVRTEGERKGQPIWMIFRPQDKRILTLFPDRKVYTETEGMEIGRPPLPDEPESPCRKDQRFVCRATGPQGVGGRDTRLWEISMRQPQGIQPYARLWVDVVLKIAIREFYADGLEVNLENIRQEPQPQTLFEVPEGFKVENPSGTSTTLEKK